MLPVNFSPVVSDSLPSNCNHRIQIVTQYIRPKKKIVDFRLAPEHTKMVRPYKFLLISCKNIPTLAHVGAKTRDIFAIFVAEFIKR